MLTCAIPMTRHTQSKGFSIPASEHSTITSWGAGDELAAFENMLDKFPTGLVASNTSLSLIHFVSFFSFQLFFFFSDQPKRTVVVVAAVVLLYGETKYPNTSPLLRR